MQQALIEVPQRFVTRGTKPVSIPYENEAEWLAHRTHGIGGSDIGSVVGFNRYRSAVDLFFEKIGLAAPQDLSKNNAVRLGKLLEPVVIQIYEEDTGEKVHRVHRILQHPQHTWMRCSLDGRVVGKPWIVEAKTVGLWAARSEEWAEAEEQKDGVPLPYLAQGQWNIAISDAEKCVFPVLVGGQEPRLYIVERDDELIEILAQRGMEFWKRVLAAIPLVNEMRQLERSEIAGGKQERLAELNAAIMQLAPPSQTEADAFKKWGMEVEGKTTQATDEIYVAERELREWDARKKEAEEQIEQRKALIKDYMQDAETLLYGSEPLRTWKHQSSTVLDGSRLKIERPEIWQAYSYENYTRVLRAKNPPKKGKKAA